MVFACAGMAGAALLVSADMASARSGGVAPVRGGVASAHAMVRPHGIGHFRHHGRFIGGVWTYWPGYDDFGFGASGAPVGEAVPPQSNDVRYTYTYDVPWDWAHRYPPNVTPSDRPYVSSCPTESVTVPGRGGEQTVNITRCY
ncbi:hypothetical protein [Bradyrhizobium sp. STM 3557]|uniref:hypothetical protein n=1 Tax=Bradyrhizobium sp. STM 3557 TaxID=578920 RepID=UPI00388CED36